MQDDGNSDGLTHDDVLKRSLVPKVKERVRYLRKKGFSFAGLIFYVY